MTKAPESPPDRSYVRQILLDLISGRLTREAAADWASVWVIDADPSLDDLVVWRAVQELAGADLRVTPSEYLHTVEDFNEWLQKLDHYN